MKDDMIPEFLRVIALSVLQVAVFVVLHDAIVETYERYVGPMKRLGVSFGISLEFGLYLLSILACLNAIAQVFATRIAVRFLVAAAAAGLWIFYWAELVAYVPNRFAILSAVGILSFAIAVLFTFPRIEVRVELR